MEELEENIEKIYEKAEDGKETVRSKNLKIRPRQPHLGKLPQGLSSTESASNTEDLQEMWVPSPGLRRSPGGGNGNSLQCSCWENPMDRGAWRAKAHGVTKSWT